jgi:hypothetical protein
MRVKKKETAAASRSQRRIPRSRLPHIAALIGLLLGPSAALAHSFGRSYTPPVPIPMYLYGAAAALVASFMLVAWFVTASAARVRWREVDLGRIWTPAAPTRRWLIGGLRALSLGLLLLAIATGFLGTDNPYRNLNMTLFWVIFCLGFTYLTALLGDWFAVLNPFRVIADGAARAMPQLFRGRWHYPAWLAYWPALVFYMGFIWIELLGHATPLSLSMMLSIYAGITILGSGLFGRRDWFEHCEFFGVFLRLIARMAPLRLELDKEGHLIGIHLRPPFTGLIQDRPIPASLLVFVLFMLSSTAFDGLMETALWVGTFWTALYQYILIPIHGATTPLSHAVVEQLFFAYQTAALLLSPFVYLGVYALILALAKLLIRSDVPLKTLLLSFGLSIVPIAFAYHLSHYYTLLQVQGPQLARLISDPLGRGWNLFGTARTAIKVVPDMDFVWHAQVVLIVAGHVVSVYLAHLQALRSFADSRSAVLSQIPTLLLMIVFTTSGLWILSLPLNPGGGQH